MELFHTEQSYTIAYACATSYTKEISLQVLTKKNHSLKMSFGSFPGDPSMLHIAIRIIVCVVFTTTTTHAQETREMPSFPRLSYLLESPELVWAVRCDSETSIIAKFRLIKHTPSELTREMIFFWAKIPPTPDPEIPTNGWTSIYEGGTLLGIMKIYPNKAEAINGSDFATQLGEQAKNARIWLNRERRSETDCKKLRVNALE